MEPTGLHSPCQVSSPVAACIILQDGATIHHNGGRATGALECAEPYYFHMHALILTHVKPGGLAMTCGKTGGQADPKSCQIRLTV